MTTREQDLSALRKLKRLVEERDSTIKKREHCIQSLGEIEYKVDTAGYRKEETNNYENALRETDEKKFSAVKAAKKRMEAISAILLVAVFVAMVITLIRKGYFIALLTLAQPLFGGLIWFCFKDSILAKIAFGFGVLYGLGGILVGSEGVGVRRAAKRNGKRSGKLAG